MCFAPRVLVLACAAGCELPPRPSCVLQHVPPRLLSCPAACASTCCAYPAACPRVAACSCHCMGCYMTVMVRELPRGVCFSGALPRSGVLSRLLQHALARVLPRRLPCALSHVLSILLSCVLPHVVPRVQLSRVLPVFCHECYAPACAAAHVLPLVLPRVLRFAFLL